MPRNARRRRPGDTGGPWGTGLLLIGLALTAQGIGYILTDPTELRTALAWINSAIPISGWGMLWVGAGVYSIVRALCPPQRPSDVAPAVFVIGLWAAFYAVFWIYVGLWRGEWSREWSTAIAWLGLACLLVCFSRTVNPPTGRR